MIKPFHPDQCAPSVGVADLVLVRPMKRALIGCAVSAALTAILLIAVELAPRTDHPALGAFIIVLISPAEWVSYVLWRFFSPDRHADPSAFVRHSVQGVTTFLWIAGILSPLLFDVRFGRLSRNRSQAAALGIGALAILVCTCIAYSKA